MFFYPAPLPSPSAARGRCEEVAPVRFLFARGSESMAPECECASSPTAFVYLSVGKRSDERSRTTHALDPRASSLSVARQGVRPSPHVAPLAKILTLGCPSPFGGEHAEPDGRAYPWSAPTPSGRGAACRGPSLWVPLAVRRRGQNARGFVFSLRPLAIRGEGHRGRCSCSRRRPSPSGARAQRATNVIILRAPRPSEARARGLAVLMPLAFGSDGRAHGSRLLLVTPRHRCRALRWKRMDPPQAELARSGARVGDSGDHP